MIDVAVSIFPVFIFLGVLVYYDSYKLVKIKTVLLLIGYGCLAAGAAFLINIFLLNNIFTNLTFYVRYIAPVVEETLKSALIIYLILKNKTGFLVDAAIYGFAAGAGFAFIENIYYLNTVESGSILLWIIRGFGTAVMHGGTAAIFSLLTKNMYDRFSSSDPQNHLQKKQKKIISFFLTVVPGFVSAVLIHSFFNHLVLPAHLITLLQLILLPALIVFIFRRSEAALKDWMVAGLDNEVQILEQIDNGNFSESYAGQYLLSLQKNFPGAAVADMLCLIKIHIELSIKAKGVMLMRKAGLPVIIEDEVKDKLIEMKFLEKSIGPVGKLAVAPVFAQSTKDLWQVYILT